MASLKDFGFEDIKVIGRGQYGKAHLVKSNADNRQYIAKTIDLTCLSRKERETAEQEVELLRRLEHPNIVAYKDNFFMGETLVIVMQYCDGGDVSTFIKERASQKPTRGIPEDVIMNYFVQILHALQHIHEKRILHRDLKTSNLFLTQQRKIVKLGDFGISRVLEGSIEAAITVVGTPYYMSPEVCENKPYTFKSDVWSLGCVLYELCMLKHAFSADNLLGLVYKIVSDNYEKIPDRYSSDLNSLIKGMLTKKADDRPSVGDLLTDPYVRRFISDYVRTRGQCATLAGAASLAGQRTTSSGSSTRPGRTSIGSGVEPNVTGTGFVGGPTAARGRGGATGSRLRQPRAQRPARAPPPGGVDVVPGETPKERMARRKRELADRKAEELKAAARQTASKPDYAKEMKKAELHTTRIAGGMSVMAPPSSNTWRPHEEYDGKPHEAWPLQGDSSTVSGTHTPEEELDVPLEEISEYETDDSYEDDFEEVYTEDELPEELDDEYDDHYTRRAEVGHLSTVQEEQDLTRVMSNYEQDLQRTDTFDVSSLGPSPVARRSGEIPTPVTPATLTASRVSSSQIAGGMDMRSRANRLREELTRKMGPETFKLTFDFLLNARRQQMDENAVKRDLVQLIGRDTYKTYCFEVDQLVFQQMNYT